MIGANVLTRLQRILMGLRLHFSSRSSAKTGASSDIFAKIYHTNYWGNEESRSGGGSDMEQTRIVRVRLPLLLKEIGVDSLLDIPCGDFHWMKTLNLDVNYIGADVVPDIIERNRAEYEGVNRRFECLDLTKDSLPKVGAIFCRDALVHFSISDINKALKNIVESGAEYLITTTFVRRERNIDIITGQWRPVNFSKPPFSFCEPLILINENCTEGDGSWNDKSLGVWRVDDIKDAVSRLNY